MLLALWREGVGDKKDGHEKGKRNSQFRVPKSPQDVRHSKHVRLHPQAISSQKHNLFSCPTPTDNTHFLSSPL